MRILRFASQLQLWKSWSWKKWRLKPYATANESTLSLYSLVSLKAPGHLDPLKRDLFACPKISKQLVVSSWTRPQNLTSKYHAVRFSLSSIISWLENASFSCVDYFFAADIYLVKPLVIRDDEGDNVCSCKPMDGCGSQCVNRYYCLFIFLLQSPQWYCCIFLYWFSCLIPTCFQSDFVRMQCEEMSLSRQMYESSSTIETVPRSQIISGMLFLHLLPTSCAY